MQIPVWLKPGLWGAAAGAVAMTVVGFSQLGWYTGGSADRMAQDRAETAVVAALVPFCVAKASRILIVPCWSSSRPSNHHIHAAIWL